MSKTKIAFDFHGVMDTFPSKFKPLMQSLHESFGRNEIIVLSGPPLEQIKRELAEAGYRLCVHYGTIISVVDFLKDSGVEMKEKENGDFYCDDDIWWKSKGIICNQQGISMLFDDKLEYKENIKSDTPLFIHVKK